MKIEVMGSGSSGNCYLLESKSEVLVIEAGIRPSKVLRNIHYPLISGVITTHEHGDHSAYVSEYVKKRIPVYMNEQCANSKKFADIKTCYYFNGKQLKIGGFSVIPFLLNHDAECYGFLIRHKDMDGILLYITDTKSVSSPDGGTYVFPDNITTVMCESDYDSNKIDENVKRGDLNDFLARRIKSSHLSLSNALDFIKTLNMEKIQNIILVHLSKNNANPKEFKKKAEMELGKVVNIAEEGLVLNLNKPF